MPDNRIVPDEKFDKFRHHYSRHHYSRHKTSAASETFLYNSHMAERTAPALNIFAPRPGPPDASARSEIMRSRLEHYFEMSVFLLLTSGFVTIATTGALDFVAVAVVSLALLVRGWFLLAGRSLSMPLSWDPYFTFGYVAFYAVDYFLLSRGFVNATVHLVLFSMVVKIFSVRRDRDYVYLTVLAFMEVLAASVLTVDTMFLAAFIVFAVLAVNTFVAFEIRRSWSASSGRLRTVDSPRNDAYAPGRFSRAISGATLSLVLGIILIASAIFFVLPRLTAGYFSRFAPRNRIESGFSDDVRFGQIGEIQLSNAVAMHIQIFGDATGAHDLKWRGVALSLFDGRQWFNPLPRTLAPAELAGCFNVTTSEEPRNEFVCAPSLPRNDRSLRYRVLMEPIGTNVFFLAPAARSLSGKYREVMVDAAGSVYNSDANRPIGTYEATSDLSSPPPEKLRTSANSYSAAIALRYLQLPKVDPHVQQLASQITASDGDPYDKAVAMERYLQTNFAYTLQMPQVSPSDPIANFLFVRKAGHCEYFASSMAIMLRTIGIPSRIVNGFRGGEFNDVSGNYIIRARDAHSWVEAYFPGSGWVSFDPTPAGISPSAVEHSRTALYLDAMREFWREWIINYDFGHQTALGNMGALRTTNAIERLRQWTRDEYVRLILRGFDLQSKIARGPKRWVYAVLGALTLLAVLLNLRRILRAITDLRLTRNPGNAPEAAASLWYRRMTRALARRGWPKLPSQTPAEFTSTISDPALRTTVALFTTHYERARFADSALDAERLPSLYETVRATTRQQ
jgi:transglutaminase-like putative cysteine protease